MIDDNDGWGNSAVATKYIYERVKAILDFHSQEDMAYHLSRLSDELARNYLIDTGNKIGAD